jgi:serine/threonine protein phosphatase PrpC
VIINIAQKENGVGNWPSISYFSIFDGHGGTWVADFLKNNLHNFII